MTRFIVTSLVGIIAATSAWAQTTTEDTTSLADQTPAENVTSSALNERAPGNMIQDALTRHNELIDERVNGTGTDTSTSDSSTGTNGASSTSTGTSGISSILSTLTGGSSLTDTVTSLLGGSSGTSGGSAADAIRQTIDNAIAASGGTTAKTADGADTTSTSKYDLTGGAFDRLPKTELREQSVVSTDEEPFRIRLVNAWLGAVFTALTFGFQTQDFIDLLESGLTPLFTASSTDSGSGSGSGSSTNSSGVESVDPNSGDSSNGSVVKPYLP